jgi:hypothetical protein
MTADSLKTKIGIARNGRKLDLSFGLKKLTSVGSELMLY